MATNKQLKKSIAKAAAEDDLATPDVEDLKKSELTEVLEGLTPGTATVYVVAEGVAVTSKRGVIGPGKKIESADLSGGRSAFDALQASGKIVKK